MKIISRINDYLFGSDTKTQVMIKTLLIIFQPTLYAVGAISFIWLLIIGEWKFTLATAFIFTSTTFIGFLCFK